jgi:hypothetical protein
MMGTRLIPKLGSHSIAFLKAINALKMVFSDAK